LIDRRRFLSSTRGRDEARRRAAEELASRNSRMLLYGCSIVVSTLGVCYASVPLYKVFCQTTGFGGTTKRAEGAEAEALMRPVEDGRVLRVTFDAHVSDSLDWSFAPAQRDIRLVPGESALAFYTATNHADHPITGVATYNVQPPQAGQYFVKIQCFCFDEQRLAAGEEVDMPVLFVVDPKYLDDPALKRVSNLTLSYNFFKTSDDDDDDDDDDDEEEEDDVEIYPGDDDDDDDDRPA
jgi:cytochrome c oxidase assembly protein subunit 11